MDCRYDRHRVGSQTVACFDCTECAKKDSFCAGECLHSTVKALGSHQGIERIQFKRKDYVDFYGKEKTDLISEIALAVGRLCETEPWKTISDCGKSHREWRSFAKDLVMKEALLDPTKAYEMASAVIGQYRKGKAASRCESCCVEAYLKVLEKIKSVFGGTRIVREHIEGRTLQEIMQPVRLPFFVASRLDTDVPGDALLLETYCVGGSDVRIFNVEGIRRLYFIDPPELHLSHDEVGSLSELREKVLCGSVEETLQPAGAREQFRRMGSDFFKGKTGKTRLPLLSDVFARYTAGYGLLEVLFEDTNINDVYVDSPAGSSPVYVQHHVFGTCDTNLYLSDDELEKLSSKFRSICGRPFDEANPVMDMELIDLGIRVAGIREPATFEGIAYSFRRRRETPWTLPRFVCEGMMSTHTAALLSVLIDGGRSILVTGARGSGKTSLLCALLAEIRQSERILVMEDTPEIPSGLLRDLGWRVEHLRNQAAVSRHSDSSYELSPEENLRAALRLGESVLVLGEVRSTEARALFEAMRVGAAGSCVLGTIHGSSPFDTWDRVTNDLSVPASSFKAVDVIISLGYRERRGLATRERYVRSVTEVRKDWLRSPLEEGGFFDVMRYDNSENAEVFDLRGSNVLEEIAMRKDISFEELECEIDLNRRMLESLIENAGFDGRLFELEHVLQAKKEYLRLMNHESVESSRIDLSRLHRMWASWLEDYSKRV